MMDLLQVYGTTLVTRGRTRGPDLAFRLMTVPRRMVDEESVDLLTGPSAFVKETELPAAELVPFEARQLPDVLLAILAAEGPDAMRWWNDPEWLAERRREDPELDGFAQYVAFADVVPFEYSKMSSTSLTTVAVGSATAVAVKAIPAIAATTVAPPIALALVGAAVGVLVVDGIGVVVGLRAEPATREAEEGFRASISRLLRRRLTSQP